MCREHERMLSVFDMFLLVLISQFANFQILISPGHNFLMYKTHLLGKSHGNQNGKRVFTVLIV